MSRDAFALERAAVRRSFDLAASGYDESAVLQAEVRERLLGRLDYVTLVPEVARIGIGNFFANAQDLWSSVNNLLQGRFERSVIMTMRFATNSVFGAFGLIDIATAVGMER